MTISAWFLLGCLAGLVIAEVMILTFMKVGQGELDNEKFVKKLIEQKGWTEARWELETSYRGKYMRIWRRLYREHIEGEDKDEQ